VIRKNIDKTPITLIKAGNFEEFLYERDSALLEISTESEDYNKEVQARLQVQRALLWLSINKGFFAQLIANLNVYGSSSLDPPTMATNGLNLVYHPDFVLTQTKAAIRFILCHEVLHCAGQHMSRRGTRHPLVWNWAADYVINPILDIDVDSNFEWPVNKDGSRMGLFEEKYAGMRAEDVYEIIMDELGGKPPPDGGDGGDGDGGPGGDSGPPDGASDFGHVLDAEKDLPGPDSDASVAQEVAGGAGPGDEDEGDIPDGKGAGGDEEGDGDGEKGDGPPPSIKGMQVRVTSGPHKGKTGKVKDVLPNGDIIIE